MFKISEFLCVLAPMTLAICWIAELASGDRVQPILHALQAFAAL